MRPYLYGGLVLALIALGAWLYWTGKQSAEVDRARDNLETRERIDDALDRPDGCSWLDRMQHGC